MKWLTAEFNREGPGIPKGLPRKTGLALLAQIVLREWWDLFRLNLMIVVFSLPLVTIPATLAAASRVLLLMVDDENLYLRRDFAGAFRALFWRASLLGFALAVALGFGAYAIFVYGQMAAHALAYAVPFAVAVAAELLLLLAGAAGLVLLGRRPGLSVSRLLRLAVTAALLRPLPLIAAWVAVGLLWLLHILFYPASVIMPAAFNFSIGLLFLVLAGDFAVRPALAAGGDERQREDDLLLQHKI